MAGDNLFTWALLDAWHHFRQHGEDMILAQKLANPDDRHRFAGRPLPRVPRWRPT